MRPDVALSGWNLIDRARQAFPVYADLLPPRNATFAALPLARVTIWILATETMALAVPNGSSLAVAAMGALALAAAGPRKGQRTYIERYAQAVDLAALLDLKPDALYWKQTSALPMTETFAAGSFVAATALLNPHPAQPLLFAGLLITGGGLRESIAHLAVATRDIRIPQYAFLLVGAGMAATGSLLLVHAWNLPHANTLDPLVLTLALAAISSASIIGARATAHTAAHTSLGFTTVLPAWRGRRMPLPLRMWTVSSRESTSLTLGFTVLPVVLAGLFGRKVPEMLAAAPPYVLPELTVAVMYVCSLAIAVMLREPLDMRNASKRLNLYRMVGVDMARGEIRVALYAMLLTLPAWTGPLIAELASGTPMMATMVPACGLVAQGAVSTAVLGAVRPSRHVVVLSDISPAQTLGVAFPALMVALLMVGFESTNSGGKVALAIAPLLCSAAIHLWTLRTFRKTYGT